MCVLRVCVQVLQCPTARLQGSSGQAQFHAGSLMSWCEIQGSPHLAGSSQLSSPGLSGANHCTAGKEPSFQEAMVLNHESQH